MASTSCLTASAGASFSRNARIVFTAVSIRPVDMRRRGPAGSRVRPYQCGLPPRPFSCHPHTKGGQVENNRPSVRPKLVPRAASGPPSRGPKIRRGAIIGNPKCSKTARSSSARASTAREKVKDEYLDAQARQPPRPGHRRDRHRQDRDAAGPGRGLFRRRRAGVLPPTSRATSRALPRMGEPKDCLLKRADEIGLDRLYVTTSSRSIFWDLFGEQGHPVRATISEMGPLLLSPHARLNDTQEGVLNIAFKRRRRGGPAAARPQGPAGAAGRCRGATPSELSDQIRQRRHGHGRRHPARAAGAGAAGRRQFLRRAGARRSPT